MTKVCTHGQSGELALRMLEQSLRRLRTDHLDLWQIHGIVYDTDGHLELFKSTKRYDGAVGRAQHGCPPSAELLL
jgi:aryl-alcohol dehydrogenase-like predicted oxidoreductase